MEEKFGGAIRLMLNCLNPKVLKEVYQSVAGVISPHTLIAELTSRAS